jgi:hypothetical protein
VDGGYDLVRLTEVLVLQGELNDDKALTGKIQIMWSM